MASELKVRVRLAMKTAAEWANMESNIKPMHGELCVYSDTGKAKIGDGNTYLKDLEFLWLSPDEVSALITDLENDNAEKYNDILEQLGNYVPTTRTVNGKTLSANIELSASDVDAIPITEKGAANGVAQLDENGYVPSSQLPSFVDDVVEGYLISDVFYEDAEGTKQITPESGKIYVDLSGTKCSYRWSGSTYVEISSSLALGETSATAYAGDKGKAVADKVADIIDGDYSDGVVKYTNDMATVSALGGIAAGTTFDNMPITTLLTKLLYPYIAPVVSASATPNGGTYENGTSVAVTKITVNVTKKSEEITRVEIFDGSTSLGVKTDGATGSLVFTVDLSVTGSKKYTAKVTDASGKVVTANTGTFSFVNPYYYGAINESDVIDSALVTGLTKSVTAKGTKSFAYITNNQMMVLAYPKSYGTISKILDPNSFDVTATWTPVVVPVTIADGSSVDYYVYTSKVVTVDNYTMKFSY